MQDRALDDIPGQPEPVDAAFDSFMPRKVNNLLPVTSLYDCYTFIEDGRISEMLFSEHLEIDLRYTPSFERVSTAQEALQRIRAKSFDLIISMPRLGDMDVPDFGRPVREIAPGIPVVMLAAVPMESEMEHPRRLSWTEPLEIALNSHRNQEVMGKTITHCGGSDAGQTVKAGNQIQVALNVVGLAGAQLWVPTKQPIRPPKCRPPELSIQNGILLAKGQVFRRKIRT